MRTTHAWDTKHGWSLQENTGDGFLLRSIISGAFLQLFLHLPSARCRRVEHFRAKAFGIILNGGGGLHMYSDARSLSVFVVCCGLTQQFFPARLLFYTIPFFIPFTVDGGL